LKVGSFLPKCPYEDVFPNIGLSNPRASIYLDGCNTKFLLTILNISLSVKPSFAVPYVSTYTDSGSFNPIDYDICTRALLHNFACTKDFATHLAAYAADLSTLLGSFPLNAPPPWAPQPPYVSTIILRPVSPASASGPPVTNLPDGFMKNEVFSSISSLGITYSITCFFTPS